MFTLKKILDFRASAGTKRGAWADDEKPFLDHLEDLRKMLFKVLGTLLLAVMVCFGFHKQIYKVLLEPLKISQKDNTEMLVDVSSARWNRAKLWAEVYADLPSDQQREAFLEEVGRKDNELIAKAGHKLKLKAPTAQAPLEVLLEAAAIYRAADSLRIDPDEKDRGPAPQAFFDRAANPKAAKLAGELWDYGAVPDISPLSRDLQMQALGPPEAFMMSMQISLYAAVIVSFPLLLVFLAQFILPGLTEKERKALYPALGVGMGLFLTGVLFAFFVMVPKALSFFHDWGSDLGLSEQWRIGYYISFVTRLTLVSGVSFELPVVMLTLIRLGLVTVTVLRSGRIWAYAIIMLAAAFITPPDAFTLALLAGPMLILYEITILIGAAMERKDRKREAEEERKYRERVLTPALDLDDDDDDGDDPDDDPNGGGSGGDSPDDSPDNDGPGGPVAAPYSAPEPVVRKRTGIAAASSAAAASGEPKITEEPKLTEESPEESADEQPESKDLSESLLPISSELGPEPIDPQDGGWDPDYVDPWSQDFRAEDDRLKSKSPVEAEENVEEETQEELGVEGKDGGPIGEEGLQEKGEDDPSNSEEEPDSVDEEGQPLAAESDPSNRYRSDTNPYRRAQRAIPPDVPDDSEPSEDNQLSENNQAEGPKDHYPSTHPDDDPA